jgi:ABC-type Fe3+-hydroxamate transport system substrate-binding protein
VRIISLCPSLTELVFDLGAGDELVARTRFCIHPADGVAGVEKVGGTKNPKIERIVALAPDIVLLNEEENRVEDAEELARAGINCNVSFPVTVQDTADMVRNIGVALGRAGRAEEIARDIEQRARRVSAAARGTTALRYAYLIWHDPWMVAAGNTFVSGMLGLAGAVNVFGDRSERYPEVTSADIAAASPDVVFLSSEPFPFREEHATKLVTESGIERSRIRFVDGEYLSWHGSRTPAGIDYAESVVTASAQSR